MTVHSIAPGLTLLHGAAHSTYATYIDPRLGYTAENVDGTSIGSKLQYAQDHITRYRYNGPCMWSGNWTSVADHEEEMLVHVIVHYPPTPDLSFRNMAFVFQYSHGDPSYASSISWSDGFGSSSYTTLVTHSGGAHSAIYRKVLSYDPPKGAEGTSFSVLQFKVVNCTIINPSMYNIGERVTSDADIVVDGGDCSPGMIVSATDHSIRGLLKQIGTGANNVQSMERLTRRVFFNQCEPQGLQITQTDSQGTWLNMFDELDWQAKCRDLLGDSASHHCYPALIVKQYGNQEYSQEIKIRYKSGGSDWTYTCGAADADDTYLLLQPWRTGSSSSDGLHISSASHDDVTIEGYIDDSQSDATLTLYAWALFEGPAW